MYFPAFRSFSDSNGDQGLELKTGTDVIVPANLLKALFTFLISEIEVDEELYLSAYDDVRMQVESKLLSSGAEHFHRFGWYEGRRTFREEFDEKYYLNRNRDVRDAIDKGEFASALEHYLRHGHREFRSPSKKSEQDVVYWRIMLQDLR